jgi:hypothetical protein
MLSIVSIIALFALAACSTTSSVASGTAPLGNAPTFWILTSLTGAPAEHDAILHLEGQSLSLDVPCYRRSWAYSADTGRLPRAWASIARCGETIPPVIALFDTVMPTVSDVRVSGDELTLRDASGRLVLSGHRLVSSGIENREWAIESYFDGHSVVSTRDIFNRPKAAIVTFIHGSLLGTPGCGGLSGNYNVTGRQITIENAGAILAGSCLRRDEHGIVDEWPLNQPVLDALNGVRTIEPHAEGFVLRDSVGTIQVVLVPSG